MSKTKKRNLGFFLSLALLLLFSLPSFASSGNPYLDIGILLYEQGYYKEALSELETALEHDPENPEIFNYIDKAHQSLDFMDKRTTDVSLPVNENVLSKEPLSSPAESVAENSNARDQAINQALAEFSIKESVPIKSVSESPYRKELTSYASAAEISPAEEPIALPKITIGADQKTDDLSAKKQTTSAKAPDSSFLPPPVKEEVSQAQEKPTSTSVHGVIHFGYGYESGDSYWRNANFDLNEKNFRAISWDRLNRRLNTFDPAIYDRLEFDVDTEPVDNPLSFHTNISLDQWSYLGKSSKQVIYGTNDYADVQILYSGNTAYTMNMDVDTLNAGDLVSIPELKFHRHQISSYLLQTKFSNTLLLPDTEVKTWFQPVREFWFNYEPTENFKTTVFPLALEDKAYTSDDPLRLSNNRTWWEESPWLSSWKKGHYNPKVGIAPPYDVPDFTKGRWDDALAFAVRDSDGKRLTGLRGMTMAFDKEQTEIDFTVASPKTLWQDYDLLNSLGSSFRAKQHLSDQFYIGTLENFRAGFTDEDDLDSYNAVAAFDTGFMLNSNSLISAEYSFSYLKQDLTDKDYDSKKDGSAYNLDLMFTSSDIQTPDKDYFRIQPGEGEQNFFKTRLRMTRMDNGFQSSLSTYLETRDDEYWGRHLTFRDPVSFKTINFNDIDPYRIGNGIDYDRYTINWRTDTLLLDKKIKGLTDIRNVHESSTNKYIETVARTEWGWQPNEQFETKGLLLAHHLPRTTGGFDPFITRIQDGEVMANSAIPDDMNANLYTTSLGMKYWFFNWLAWDGTWERTNDFTVATDNYPRGILNDKSMATYTSYGKIYREEYAYLYGQGAFPLPPYEFHNIFRTGLTFKPSSKWDIYLDYTRNPYEWAGPLDDNLNHVSLSTMYTPTKNLLLYTKYTWSRMNDINQVVYGPPGGDIDFRSHHNFFIEGQYMFKDESTFAVSFGVGPSVANGYATSNPYGGSVSPVLDTQHMVRMSYTKNF